MVLPPLTEALSWLAGIIADVLGDALRWVTDFIGNDLGPIFAWLNDNILQPLIDTFQGIIDAVKSVLDWLGDLWDSLEGAKDSLPDWLVPGSPTPFELGLRGIADALNGLSFDAFNLNVTGQAAPAIAGGGALGGAITVQVYGPFGPGYTPEEAGRQAGQGLAETLRARGLLA